MFKINFKYDKYSVTRRRACPDLIARPCTTSMNRKVLEKWILDLEGTSGSKNKNRTSPLVLWTGYCYHKGEISPQNIYLRNLTGTTTGIDGYGSDNLGEFEIYPMTDDSYIYEKDKIYFRKKYKNKKSEIIFRGTLTKNEIVGIWKDKDIVGSFELYLTGYYTQGQFY